MRKPRRGESTQLRPPGRWPALALCAALGIALFAFVDQTPQVEADFSFASDDPQLEGARQIEGEFCSAPQIFIVARGDELFSRQYLQRIRELTGELGRLRGVVDVRS